MVATWGSAAMPGLTCTAGQSGASAILPAYAQLGWPLTIACAFRVVGTPDTNAASWGILYYGGPPYNVIQGSYNPNWAINYNAGGTQQKLTSSTAAVAGSDVVLSATITATAQTLYLNGALIASSAIARANPTYTVGSAIQIGYPSSFSYNPNMIFYWGGVWAGVFPTSWHASIGANPNAIWQIFQPMAGPAWFGQPAAGPSFLPWLYGDQCCENGC